jgi:hypothetical protein
VIFSNTHVAQRQLSIYALCSKSQQADSSAKHRALTKLPHATKNLSSTYQPYYNAGTGIMTGQRDAQLGAQERSLWIAPRWRSSDAPGGCRRSGRRYGTKRRLLCARNFISGATSTDRGPVVGKPIAMHGRKTVTACLRRLSCHRCQSHASDRQAYEC